MPDAVTMLTQADGIDALTDDFRELASFAREHGVAEPTIPVDRAIEMGQLRALNLRAAAGDQVLAI